MRYLKFLIVLSIIAILLVFFFQNVDFTEVITIIKNINLIYPLLFIIGTFSQFLLRAYRWGIILKPYKNKIPFSSLFKFSIIGAFINIIVPGRVGEPAKGILLAKEEGIKKSYGLASVLLERLIDFLMIVLLFLVSLFFIKDNNSQLLGSLKVISFYLLPIILLIFSFFYLINLKRVFFYFEKIIFLFVKIFPVKIREKVTNFILNFVKGLRIKLSFFEFLKLLSSSMMVWLIVIPFYWILLKGFDINISFFETIPFFSIIVVAASVPTPGMAGSLDAGSKLALTKLFLVSSEKAVAFTLLFHFTIIIFTVITGLIALIMQGYNIKSLKELKEKK